MIVTGGHEAEVAGAPPHPSIEAKFLDVRDEASAVSLFGLITHLDALINCAGAADPASEFTGEGFGGVATMYDGMQAASIDWDGRDPIRTVASLSETT